MPQNDFEKNYAIVYKTSAIYIDKRLIVLHKLIVWNAKMKNDMINLSRSILFHKLIKKKCKLLLRKYTFNLTIIKPIIKI